MCFIKTHIIKIFQIFIIKTDNVSWDSHGRSIISIYVYPESFTNNYLLTSNFIMWVFLLTASWNIIIIVIIIILMISYSRLVDGQLSTWPVHSYLSTGCLFILACLWQVDLASPSFSRSKHSLFFKLEIACCVLFADNYRFCLVTIV